MKRLLIILACFSFSLLSCKKHFAINPSDNPYGLPNATQSGANTLGFLLNGQAWTPKGFNGTSNLSIDFDFGFNNGVFGISAYRIISDSNRLYFGIGIKDSLNFYSAPCSFQLTNYGLYRVYFSSNNCAFYSTDSNTSVKGTLTLSKLDRIHNIIAGTFDATLYKSGCDTIQITQGRFDMKF